MLPALLALVGLVLDGTFLAGQLLQLQAAADAAARAATDAYDRVLWESAGRVVINDAGARILASEYLAKNMSTATLVTVTVPPARQNTVEIKAKATVRFAFMTIVGIRDTEIAAWSVAKKE